MTVATRARGQGYDYAGQDPINGFDLYGLNQCGPTKQESGTCGSGSAGAQPVSFNIGDVVQFLSREGAIDSWGSEEMQSAAKRFFRDAPRTAKLYAKNLGDGRVALFRIQEAADPAQAGQKKVFAAIVDLGKGTMERNRWTQFADGTVGEERGWISSRWHWPP